MKVYDVQIGARKVGAISRHREVKRNYRVWAESSDQVSILVISRAYEDGDIEHVWVEKVTEIGQVEEIEKT